MSKVDKNQPAQNPDGTLISLVTVPVVTPDWVPPNLQSMVLKHEVLFKFFFISKAKILTGTLVSLATLVHFPCLGEEAAEEVKLVLECGGWRMICVAGVLSSKPSFTFYWFRSIVESCSLSRTKLQFPHLESSKEFVFMGFWCRLIETACGILCLKKNGFVTINVFSLWLLP